MEGRITRSGPGTSRTSLGQIFRRRLQSQGDGREVQFQLGDLVEVVGQEVHRDMTDDLGDLAVREAGGPDRSQLRAGHGTPRFENTPGKGETGSGLRIVRGCPAV